MFDESQSIVCRVESEIDTYEKLGHVVEHDPVQLIDSVFDVLKKCQNHLGGHFFNICAAGLATQRSSFVCWDKLTGDAFMPIISWQDRRTVNDLAQYNNSVEYIHETTGLYLNPHYGASKISWCLQNEKLLEQPLKDNRLCIAPLASFILFHLLEGRPYKVDPANASRTLLMDSKSLEWDTKLLEVFGIPQTVLPEIVDTQCEFGNINYDNHRIPLTICTGDQSAAIYASGKPSADSLYVNIGTGAFVQKYSDKKPEVQQTKLLSSVIFSSCNTNSYVIEGTVNGAARALDWLSHKYQQSNVEKDLDEWAIHCQNPSIFINGISGVGSPYWIPDLKSYFLQQGSLEEEFVGVLESIVFLIFSNIKAMGKLGENQSKVIVTGGLSKSDALCQKLSDLSNNVVKRNLESEATTLGVYFLMTGKKVDVTKSKFKEFFPTKNSLLASRYERWSKKMDLLAEQ